MLAYHNDPKIKESILLQLKAHYDADQFIKGIYWKKGKGCAVGCTIHGNNHARYEIEFGIPRILAKFEDNIFEELPNSLAKEWPIKFMSAINVGSDLSNVWKKFIIWLLCDPKYGVINYAKTQQVKDSIKLVCDQCKDWLLKKIEPKRYKEVKEIALGAYTYIASYNAAATNIPYDAAVTDMPYDANAVAINANAYAAYYYAIDAIYTASDALYPDDTEQDHYIAQSEKLLELLKEEKGE